MTLTPSSPVRWKTASTHKWGSKALTTPSPLCLSSTHNGCGNTRMISTRLVSGPRSAQTDAACTAASTTHETAVGQSAAHPGQKAAGSPRKGGVQGKGPTPARGRAREGQLLAATGSLTVAPDMDDFVRELKRNTSTHCVQAWGVNSYPPGILSGINAPPTH